MSEFDEDDDYVSPEEPATSTTYSPTVKRVCADSTTDKNSNLASRKKSLVWKFFKKGAEGTVRCLNCSHSLATTDGSTKWIRSHLKHNHRAEYEKMKQEEEEQKERSKKHAPRPLTDFFKVSPSVSNLSKADRFLLEYVVEARLPFSHVHSGKLRRMMQALFPDFKPHDRSYVAGTMMPKYADELIGAVASELPHLYSATSDIWSSPRSGCSLIVFTLSYFVEANGRLERRVKLLDLRPFNKSHTAKNIQYEWTQMLERHGLKKTAMLSVTRDGGANVVAACREFGIPSSIKGVPELSELLLKVGRLATLLHRSPALRKKYEEILEDENLISKKMLPRIVPTRWNGVVECSRSTEYLHRAIRDAA